MFIGINLFLMEVIMLFKNNMRPAYATASDGGFSQNKSSKKENRFAVFSEEDSGDFGSFNESQSHQTKARTSTPRQTKVKSSKSSSFSLAALPWKPILIGAAAVVALILLIVLAVAVISAPQKQIKMEDNAFFVYSDSDGKYHVVSNGKTIKHDFVGEVTLVPAEDNSFAYVREKLTGDAGTGERVYILEGTKLKDIEVKADQIVAFAEFEPGIIYKKNSRFYHYHSGGNPPISNDPSADNFMISSDGSIVVFTIESKREPGTTELRYFKNGGAETIGPKNFIPVSVSKNGKYVYGINEANSTLYYIEVKKDKDKNKTSAITTASHGAFNQITGMNVDGDEIVFYTDTEKGIVSYLYRTGDDGPTPIAEGLFTPINADKQIACPDTFVNSYFICEKDLVDESGATTNATLTYFYDKDGARKLAEATGQFSPDCKYFYYVDEYGDLVRVPLDSKDFEDSTEEVLANVTDFAVVAKGDVYVMINDVNVGILFYWDASTKRTPNITYDAKLGSMELCGNSVYFTEEIDGETKIYVSTEGSAKVEASFKSAALTSTPKMVMGAGEKGYAYFTDENNNTMLFYTSNGEKFSLVANSCVVDGTPVATEKPTEKETTDEDEDEDEE